MVSKSEVPMLVVNWCEHELDLVLGSSQCTSVQCIDLRAPTLASFCKALRKGHNDQPYPMVHLSGSISERGLLCMKNETGREELVAPEQLAAAFRNAGVMITLVNLYSGVDFVPALLKAGVLTVVTTLGEISAPEAMLLAQELSLHLTAGNTVGVAHNFAQQSLVVAYCRGYLQPPEDWGGHSLEQYGRQRAANIVLCGDQQVYLPFLSLADADAESISGLDKPPNNFLHINSFLLAQMEELKSRPDVLLTTLVTALADREEAWDHWSAAILHLTLELLREDLQEKIEAGNGETYDDLAKALATIMGAFVQLEQKAHASDPAKQAINGSASSISAEKFLPTRERAQMRHRVQGAGFVKLESPLVLDFSLFFIGLVLCVLVFVSASLLRVWEAEQVRQREARLDGILAAQLVKNVLDAAAGTSLGTTPVTLTSFGHVNVRPSADGGVYLVGSVSSMEVRNLVVRLATAVVGPERVHAAELRVEVSIAPPERYIVRNGDTLWRIAAKSLGHGHRWTEITEVNSSLNPRKMPVGLELALP